MKNLSKRKKQLLLAGFCVLFIAALLLSINHNRITIKPMYIPAHIGRTLTDSLTHKK
jgi:hypothetical protein